MVLILEKSISTLLRTTYFFLLGEINETENSFGRDSQDCEIEIKVWGLQDSVCAIIFGAIKICIEGPE